MFFHRLYLFCVHFYIFMITKWMWYLCLVLIVSRALNLRVCVWVFSLENLHLISMRKFSVRSDLLPINRAKLCSVSHWLWLDCAIRNKSHGSLLIITMATPFVSVSYELANIFFSFLFLFFFWKTESAKENLLAAHIYILEIKCVDRD